MADGTVTGRLEFSAGPAKRELRDLRTVARGTDTVLHQLGTTMDGVATPKHTAQLKAYREEQAKLGRTSKTTHTVYRSQWRQSDRQVTRSVNRQIQQIRSLRLELVRLGHTRQSAHVEVTGVGQALLEVRALNAELNNVHGRTANVNVRGGAGATEQFGGRGRVPPENQRRSGGGGGFGGGFRSAEQSFVRSISAGPFSIQPRAVGAFAAVGLPAMNALVGATGAFVSVLGSATAGVGALGAAAAGAAVGGIGTIAAVAKPALGRINAVVKAQDALTKAQGRSATTSRSQRTQLDAIRQAHYQMADAQYAALEATRQLTEARRESARAIVDERLQLARSRLGLRQSAVDVAKAKQAYETAYWDASADPLDVESARLNLSGARLDRRQSRMDVGRGRADLGRMQRAGVNGSPAVRAAVHSQQMAARQMREARRGLTDAAHDVAEGATTLANAKAQIDEAFRRAPRGTRALVRDLRQFQSLWGAGGQGGRARDPNVRGAQEGLVGFLRGGLKIGTKMTPALGKAGRTGIRALNEQLPGLDQFLAGPATQRFLSTSSQMFAENLTSLRRAGQYTLETWYNITTATRPFLRQGTRFIEKWTKGWRDGTKDIGRTRGTIRNMIEDLRRVKSLLFAGGGLVKDLAVSGRGAGGGLLDSMTAQLVKWDDWIKRNPKRVTSFFQETVDSAKSLASALGRIVGALHNIGETLRPVLDRFTQLLTLAGSAGLLTPGAGALLLGAFRGGRGAARGPVGGGGAGGGGGPLILGGMGGGGMGGGAAGMNPTAAALLGGGAAAFLARGGVSPAMANFYRQAGRLGTPAPGVLGEGRFGSLGSPTRGVLGGPRFGAPVSQLGAQGGRWTGLSRAGMVGRGAVAGAGRAYLPIAAILAGLDAASFQGDTGWQNVQAGLSSATLGVFGRPQTTAQLDDTQKRIFSRFTGNLSAGTNVRDLQGDISKLRTARDVRVSGVDEDLGSGDTYRRRVSQIKTALNQEIQARKDYIDALKTQHVQELNARSVDTATALMPRLRGQYHTLRKGGKTAGQALTSVVGTTLGRIQGRGAGAKALAEDQLAFAQNVAKAHPGDQDVLAQVDRLEKGIIRRFKRINSNVQIVNGRILTGTRRQWKNIASALNDPMEKAEQELNRHFTTLQRQAAGALVAMGYSRKDANSFIRDLEAGGENATFTQNAIDMGAAQFTGLQNQGAKNATQLNRARGGRIAGRGVRDNVPLGGGGLGAPGELVVNRHDEMRINRMLGAYGTSLGQETGYRGAGRAHSAAPRFARGGRLQLPASFKSTHETANLPGYPAIDVFGSPGTQVLSPISGKVAKLSGRSPSAGAYGGQGGPFGWSEYISGGGKTYYLTHFGSRSVSLGQSVHRGQVIGTVGDYPGGTPDHIHEGLHGGPMAVSSGASGGSSAAAAGVTLTIPRSSLGGVPGALSARGGQVYGTALQASVNAALGGSGANLPTSGGGTPGANRRLAKRMLSDFGWGAGEWPALNTLWTGESGFNELARNASSGAYGIPQALPGSKMASAGSDWRTNAATQIQWGDGYIRDSYGSPSAALRAWQARNPHWYARGGRIRYAGAFAKGGGFVARNASAFVAGEGQASGVSEAVNVSRMRHGRSVQAGGRAILISMHFGDVRVGSAEDFDRLVDSAATRVAERVTEALEKRGN